EEEWLSNPNKNLSAMLGESVTARPAEYLFKPEEVIKIAHFTFKVVATPGHSPGGVSFIFEDDEFVITGDALFAGSVGRTDFPGSEPKELIPNIRQKLYTLPSSFTIYPGHGDSSTLAHEMTTNPFFNLICVRRKQKKPLGGNPKDFFICCKFSSCKLVNCLDFFPCKSTRTLYGVIDVDLVTRN